MNRLRSDAGQAAVVTVVFITVLLGAVALVLDVGSWFRAQPSPRPTQPHSPPPRSFPRTREPQAGS
jgi:hypothetical protein